MTLPLYQIDGWNDYFENAKSRTYDRCQYVVSPNKHGGSGWANVMGEPDGRAIWGVWKMLLDIASRQRKPREGWLTADGKKSGRRLTERELSNQLRCPLEEIQRALYILRSPEVAFIRLVDGQPESLARIAEGHLTDTTGAVEQYPSGIPREDTEVSPEYPPAILSGDIESKKVSKKASISKADGEGDTTPIPEGQSTDTGRIPDVVQHAEAKLILGRLAKAVFPDETPGAIWDNKLEHDLDEVLPLPRETVEKVDWAYRLPEGHSLFEDGPRGGGMMRVKSFAALIPNLRREASKITAARRKLGLNGLHAPKKEKAIAVPERWEEAFRELWGERSDRAERFEDLTGTQQAAVREKCREMEAMA